MSNVADQLIERFADAIWSEEGLSDNTLSAHCSDLETFERWLTPRKDSARTSRVQTSWPILPIWPGRAADPDRLRRGCSPALDAFYYYPLREKLADRRSGPNRSTSVSGGYRPPAQRGTDRRPAPGNSIDRQHRSACAIAPCWKPWPPPVSRLELANLRICR